MNIPAFMRPKADRNVRFFYFKDLVMAKIEVFVDGFNLYYGMLGSNKTQTYRKTLWFDLKSFVSKYVIKENDILENIYYFTARPVGDVEKNKRHSLYCKALENSGVNVVYGKYKTKMLYCQNCKKYFKSFEEKETDVNIALYLLKRGIKNGYDKAILFSGDSDLAPAIENAQILFPHKEYQVMFPINRNRSKRLQQVAKLTPIYHYLTHYKQCQFPYDITLANGSIISCPDNWR